MRLSPAAPGHFAHHVAVTRAGRESSVRQLRSRTLTSRGAATSPTTMAPVARLGTGFQHYRGSAAKRTHHANEKRRQRLGPDGVRRVGVSDYVVLVELRGFEPLTPSM